MGRLEGGFNHGRLGLFFLKLKFCGVRFPSIKASREVRGAGRRDESHREREQLHTAPEAMETGGAESTPTLGVPNLNSLFLRRNFRPSCSLSESLPAPSQRPFSGTWAASKCAGNSGRGSPCAGGQGNWRGACKSRSTFLSPGRAACVGHHGVLMFLLGRLLLHEPPRTGEQVPWTGPAMLDRVGPASFLALVFC